MVISGSFLHFMCSGQNFPVFWFFRSKFFGFSVFSVCLGAKMSKFWFLCTKTVKIFQFFWFFRSKVFSFSVFQFFQFIFVQKLSKFWFLCTKTVKSFQFFGFSGRNFSVFHFFFSSFRCKNCQNFGFYVQKLAKFSSFLVKKKSRKSLLVFD